MKGAPEGLWAVLAFNHYPGAIVAEANPAHNNPMKRFALGERDSRACIRLPPKNPRALISDGACRVRPLFIGQTSQLSHCCEEGRHRATHGGVVSNRVSADAVGRRGHFPQGRCSPDSYSVALEGNAPSGGAKRPRRPGLEAVRSARLRSCIVSLAAASASVTESRPEPLIQSVDCSEAGMSRFWWRTRQTSIWSCPSR